MADDTLTVEQARQAHKNAMNNLTCPLPNNHDKEWDDAVRTMDALIAAVRAPMQAAIDTKVLAHKMAIDREFALADQLEKAEAALAAVRAERDAPSEPMRCRHCGAACQVDECLDCWRQQREAR